MVSLRQTKRVLTHLETEQREQILHTGVHTNDSQFAEAVRRLAWDDFRLFLAVHSSGSFKAAAKSLALAINTVRNRISRMEDVLGVRLLERSAKGVAPTEAGLQFAKIAIEMASASHTVAQTMARKQKDLRRIDLHVSEGVGTFWIVPRLVDFHRRHPDIHIRLYCSLNSINKFDEQNSVAVQLIRPSDPSVVCSHLATLHMMPFASPQYLNKHGLPRDLEDARKHQILLQTSEVIPDSLFPALFGELPPPGLIALETNSSAAHYWAIAQGMGIGMLPTYARAITKNVVPINMDLKLRRDLWLCHPHDARESSAVRTVIRWLKTSFDSLTYPWFAENFVHPDAFENEFAGTNVVRLFAGFMEIADVGARSAR